MKISLNSAASPEQEAENAARLARAQAALTSYIDGKPPCGQRNTYFLGNGICEISVFNRRLHLSAIAVELELRRTGLGTRYLKELLAVADAHQAEIECSVDPFGLQDPQTKMGIRELTAWYKRHGFKSVKGRTRFLIRMPHPPAPATSAASVSC